MRTMNERLGEFEGRRWLESDEGSGRLLADEPMSLCGLAEIELAAHVEPGVVIARIARDLESEGGTRCRHASGASDEGELAVEVVRRSDGTYRCIAGHRHPQAGTHLVQGDYPQADEDEAAEDFLDFVWEVVSRL